ncbi:MAG: PaaI family thioesterase, partial [Alphaproteobacteria bacterium]|nr:PaaI family thioesterase [Alphaproteobacteria bacterium]
HGGALLAFADSALTAFAMDAIERGDERVATITVNSEFVAPVRLGDWIECRGAVTKLTRSLAFVRGEMTVDGETVMIGSTRPRWSVA